MENNNKTLGVALVMLGMLMLPSAAMAQSVNIGTMFANFTASAAALIELVKYSVNIIGLYLVVAAIFKYVKKSHDPNSEIKGPLIMAACGIGIFSLTDTISVVAQTMALGDGPGSILAPSGGGISAATSAALEGVITFVRLLGYIAFVRGWLFLVDYGNGKTDGTMARGLVHIGGGVAAINLNLTIKILANTLAPGISFGGFI